MGLLVKHINLLWLITKKSINIKAINHDPWLHIIAQFVHWITKKKLYIYIYMNDNITICILMSLLSS